jgi:hypothetical protein
MNQRVMVTALLAVLLGVWARPAHAERARYRYVPRDAEGSMTLEPTGGERLSLLGTVRRAAPSPPRPTHVLSFRHPATGRPVSVPVALPVGTPRVEYRFQRVIYNYGSYTVEVVFLADGSVEVVYNSGLLRAL